MPGTDEGAARPQVKILVAVWGKSYIAQLERFGLASFLAPRNLPAMARRCAVELVILTCPEDVAHFEALPLMASLRAYARVRYIPIDDLIAPGCYSTTLTLAFMRGVAAHGERMTDLHFVFWNADFVLSDGAFAHLADLIDAGSRVVITGTLRAVAEEAEAQLDAMRPDAASPLAAPPRALVELAFRHPHPHHVAKTVNQSFCWSRMPSQMLWRVDAHTTLCRFFKAFMLCLRPTRVVSKINGPCDYAFVPELCPGEPQTLIDDSDKAFILELQPRDSEAEFIRLGSADEDVRRRCMEEWLTAEHLDTGRRVVTVRSGESSPEAVEAARRRFDRYFERFMADVAPPRSHSGQYYWAFGVAAWRLHREAVRPRQPPPPELDGALAVADLKHPTYAGRHAAALRREGHSGRPETKPDARLPLAARLSHMRSQFAARLPLPLAGRGQGVGVVGGRTAQGRSAIVTRTRKIRQRTAHADDPHPLTPSPQGGGGSASLGSLPLWPPLRALLFGRPHEPRRFHPDAPATVVLERAAAAIQASAEGAIITVAEIGQWADLAFPIDHPRIYRVEPTAAAFWALRPPPLADAALVYLRPPGDADAGGLLARLSGGLAPGARVCIVLHDAGWKGRPDWIERQLKASLAAHGLLDDLEIVMHEASARERRYAELFYYALDCVRTDRRPWMIAVGLARYLPAFLLRATAPACKAPSGRPLLATITGRLRRATAPQAFTSARGALVASTPDC